jgi:hypothetical protein
LCRSAHGPDGIFFVRPTVFGRATHCHQSCLLAPTVIPRFERQTGRIAPGTHPALTQVSANQSLSEIQPLRRTAMKTLTIKDLARTEELGRADMAAVRGGMKVQMPSYPSYPTQQNPKSDSSITATQDLMQFQDVKNLTANGSAFLDCVSVNNHTSQFGQNNIAVR